jgi:hypothetical protein
MDVVWYARSGAVAGTSGSWSGSSRRGSTTGRGLWEYDARTLWEDLSAHLVYGLGTAAAFISMVAAHHAD